MSLRFPEKFRIISGILASPAGGNGAFAFWFGESVVFVIASSGEGWEHVSVSLENRVPTWDEMCSVKRLFWDAEDCVVQFHPPKSEYVNCHPYCLHLWRSLDVEMPRPPTSDQLENQHDARRTSVEIFVL